MASLVEPKTPQLGRARAVTTVDVDRLHGADVARALARCHDERGDEGHARQLREQAAEVFDALGEGELAAAARRGRGSAR
jgi:hypothetical protein